MQVVTGSVSGGSSVTSSSQSSSGAAGSLGASEITSSIIPVGISSTGGGVSASAFESRSSSHFVSSSSGDFSVGNLSGGGALSSVMSSGGGASSTVISVGGGASKYTSSSTSAMKSASYSPVTQRKSSLTLRTAGYEGDL